MKDINKQIETFFSTKVKFLRPIGPMGMILGMVGDTPPDDQTVVYRRFGVLESRMFYVKNTITVALNDMRTEGSPPLHDHLIPQPIAQTFVSVQPRQWP